MRPLATNRRMNVPSASLARFFGAMPPPTYTPPDRHHLEREIPRLAAVQAHEEVEGLDAQGALAALGDARDDGGGIARPHFISQPRRLVVAMGVAQEPIDVEQARPRHEALPADVPELKLRPKPLEQLALQRILGPEVGVAAFARKRMMRVAVPVQAGFAESRPGGDDGGVPRRVRCARIERHEVLWGERRDTVGVGLEVVDHEDVMDGELGGERAGVHHPRKIRRLASSVANRSGDAERRPLHAQRVVVDELPDDFLETRVLAASETSLARRSRAAPRPRRRRCWSSCRRCRLPGSWYQPLECVVGQRAVHVPENGARLRSG